MSVVTSVRVSLHTFNPQDAERVIDEIQSLMLREDHLEIQRFTGGGGEKSLTCDLLIGSFNLFDTEGFLQWIKSRDWFDPSGEVNQIEVLVKEVDREDFAKWKVLSILSKGD